MAIYYDTDEKAKEALSKFSGWYLIVRYGYETLHKHYGSGIRGRTCCITRYSIKDGADDMQFECFRVTKKGGLNRLRRVAKELPEGVPAVRMFPNRATAIGFDVGTGKYYILDEVLSALIERLPRAQWKDGPGPTARHRFLKR